MTTKQVTVVCGQLGVSDDFSIFDHARATNLLKVVSMYTGLNDHA